jgi:hypothetical protein
VTELPSGDVRVEAPDGSVALVPISTWDRPIKAAPGAGRGKAFTMEVSQLISGSPIQAKAAAPKVELSPDFSERVSDREIDLIKLIEEGVPELEYLPGAAGILVRGRRHLIAAPAKSGKSFSTQVHVMHMVQAGARVIVLDRENAADEYARRLEAILTAWGSSAALRKRIVDNYHYIEFPRLEAGDGPELVAWTLAAKADLVVFDSQRMFLTDQNLNEDDADDYSKFMGASVDPLFEAGIATLILDNTGHSNEGRSRGTSAKQGLNEVLFTLKNEDTFSDKKKGRVKLTLAPGDSRLGNHGEWTMGIGGGHFEEWHRLATPGAGSVQIRSSTKAEKLILARIKKGACSKTKAVEDCTGKGRGAGKGTLEKAVDALIANGKLVRDDRGYLHVQK